MIDAGDLAVGTILPLADARVAHEMLEGIKAKVPRQDRPDRLRIRGEPTERDKVKSKTGGCNVLS